MYDQISDATATAVGRAYKEIRRRIISGAYPQAARLKEEDLADDIGVSRTPVREALRRLATDGLVEFRPNHGATVASWSAGDLEQMFDLRATIEGSVVALAAERINDASVAELRALALAMERAADERDNGYLERIAELNDSFHKMILAAADSPRLARLLGQLIELPIVLRTFSCYSEEELRRSLGHHRELVAAFTVRDRKWATSVMQAHIYAAKQTLLASMSGSSVRVLENEDFPQTVARPAI